MDFHIHEKRYGGITAQQLSFQSREYQERQPCEQRNDYNAFAYQRRGIVGQMRPAQKLEERPSQDE
jgi:hypothetical protein